MIQRMPAWLLLSLASLFWAGNFVLGRGMRGHVPAVAFAFWRWAIAFLLLLPFTWRGLWERRRILLASWGTVLVLGILGVGNFNTLVYVGLQHTTATNAVLLNAACPAFIAAIAFVSRQGRASPAQLAGIALSLAGVAVILARGDLETLRAVHFNPGDVWVLAAVLSWSIYTVALVRRPAGVEPLVLLSAFILAGVAWIAPFYAHEAAQGAVVHLDLRTAGAVLYVAVFASILAYAFWNAGVAALGPTRAGVFTNLLPAFGAILSVVVLGERFQLFHAAGIALILAGVYLAGRGR